MMAACLDEQDKLGEANRSTSASVARSLTSARLLSHKLLQKLRQIGVGRVCPAQLVQDVFVPEVSPALFIEGGLAAAEEMDELVMIQEIWLRILSQPQFDGANAHHGKQIRQPLGPEKGIQG